MGTHIVFGTKHDGDDSYDVVEQPQQVAEAVWQNPPFVTLTDAEDSEMVYVRVDSIRYFYGN